jgi:hypothetical protein
MCPYWPETANVLLPPTGRGRQLPGIPTCYYVVQAISYVISRMSTQRCIQPNRFDSGQTLLDPEQWSVWERVVNKLAN